jgi:uncharacterized membrane protein (UPF0127 family)
MEIRFKNIIIADDVKTCKDIFSRGKGLRFSKPLKKGQAMLFISPEESCLYTSIDMFFVFFSIDIIWLNSDKEIIDIRRNIKPFTPLVTPKKPAKYVIELPVNSSNFLKIGNKLKF